MSRQNRRVIYGWIAFEKTREIAQNNGLTDFLDACKLALAALGLFPVFSQQRSISNPLDQVVRRNYVRSYGGAWILLVETRARNRTER